jgi:ATP-binding cassette subfamily B (MDR/TAP) protein 1
MKQGIGIGIGHALVDSTRAVVFIIIGIAYAWKLSLLLLAFLPIISGCGALLVIVTTKYKANELKSYEIAGQIVQSALSTIKTVTAFSLQKRFIDMYKMNLKETQTIMSKKSFYFGLFNGAIEALLIMIFGVCILFATHISQTECKTFGYGSIMTAIVCVVQSFNYVGNALAFLNTLTQGLFF